MRSQFPTIPNDPVLHALAASARTLDADPAATINPAFQRYSRAVLLQGSARTAAVRPPVAPMMRRLVTVAIAALIFIAISVPVLAGPSAVAGTVTNAVRAVIVYTGLPLGDLMSDQASLASQRTAATSTPPPSTNHGAVISEATATPLPTPTSTAVSGPSPTPVVPRGQQVREDARPPESQATATPTSQPAPPDRGKPDESPTKPEQGDPGNQPGNPDQGKPEDSPGNPGHGKPDEPPGKPDPGPPAKPPGNAKRDEPAPPTATPAPPTATPMPAKPDPASKPDPKSGDKSRRNDRGGGKR